MFNKKMQKSLLSGALAVTMAMAAVPFCPVTYAQEKVEGLLQITQFHVGDGMSQYQGSEISLASVCQGGTGTYSYTYRVKLPDGSSETIVKESGNEHVSYTLSETGVYNFEVVIADGKEIVSDVTECNVIPSKVCLSQVKTNKTSYQKKETMKMTIAATAATGSAVSKVTVKEPKGKTKTVKKFSSAMSAQYRFNKKGIYVFTVTVKDEVSTTNKNIRIKVR